MSRPETPSYPAFKPRQIYFMPGPLMRCVYALMICMTHVAGVVWHRFGMTGYGEETFLPATVYMLCTKTGTVGFMMLAGAALIPRMDAPAASYLIDRLLRWLPAVLFAQALFLGWKLACAPRPRHYPSWTELLEPAHYHLWFFYAIVAIYIAIIPMRWYARKVENLRGVARIAALGLPILPALAAMIVMALRGGAWGDLTPVNFVIYFGYTWTGYLLRRAPAPRLWVAMLLIAVGAVATVVLTIMVSMASGIPARQFSHRSWLGVGCLAIGQFMLLQWLDGMITAPRWRARIGHLGALTLGIFIIHPLLLDVIRWPDTWGGRHWFTWIDLPLVGIGLFTASAVIVFAWFKAWEQISAFFSLWPRHLARGNRR